MTIIQNIILPEQALQTPLNMYFRVNKNDFDCADNCESKSRYDYHRKILTLTPEDKYYFNTYYNGLSVNVWKQHCRLNTLGLKLRGRGRVQAELMLMTMEFNAEHCFKNVFSQRVLEQKDLTLTKEGVLWSIAAWPELKDGILYIALRAAESEEKTAEFYGGSFETEDSPLQSVRLGIAITHYNRKHYVLPAMQKLKWDILEHPYYSRFIDLAVVDNSRNITPREASGITVLPAANYGGAGGFARGLLHWKDQGFSHCLFMDDDVSCETESIYRTLSLLQYAKDNRLAVSGALLRECEPNFLWAKGEYFKKFGIVSPKRGLDMRRAPDLLLAEDVVRHEKDYGGFWHFAFPITETKYFPFPFFVRGDDMLFGIVNKFPVLTLNGIGTFADDFNLKETPFILYLHMRGEFLIDIITCRASLYFYLNRYKRILRGQLYAYNYAHARALSMAAEDILKGIKFWIENLDMQQVLARLAAEAPEEKIQRQAETARGRLRFPRRESLWRKFIRKATWQGFLLPGCLIKKTTALIAKNFAGNPAAGFRRETIFYYADDLNCGYYAHYDKKRFFAEWRLSWKIRLKMARGLKTAMEDYRKNWQSLASENFWRKVYGLEKLPAAEPLPAAARGAEQAQ